MNEAKDIPGIEDLRVWVFGQQEGLQECGAWLSGLRTEPAFWIRRWRPLEMWFSLVGCPHVRSLILGAYELMEIAGTDQVPEDPLSMARRVLALDWLVRDPQSDPALAGSPATRFALPPDATLLPLGHSGGLVLAGEAFLSPDLDDAIPAPGAENPADCREHIGRFLHSVDCEYWPGARYTWPQVVAETWRGVRSATLFQLPGFFTAG